MATTLMTAAIAKIKGTTTHQVGHFDSSGTPIADFEMDLPCSLSIVSDEGAIYLWRLNKAGECISDTWHMNVNEAKSQADFEFEIDNEGWREN
jgi:hypothetical protein